MSTKRIFIASLIVIGLLVGGAALFVGLSNGGGKAPQGADNSALAPAEEPEPTNQTEAIQDLINARPEIGSSEYMELFKDIKVPYVEGQSPEDVVYAFSVLRSELAELQFREIANMSFDDQVQWAVENDTETSEDTALGIIKQLNLSYYDIGYGNTLYGPDAVRSEYAEATLPTNQAIVVEMISYAIQKNLTTLSPSALVLTETGIRSSSETDIYTRPLGYNPELGATADDLNYGASMHLKVVKKSESETNWYFVNNADESF
ncbi:hypothetical protein FB472_1184 [Rhodoglobus vestalii]|uniref:Uncharacterized protein n=1 Tax=Rhodoglobus vestalii TaxID=193384 RepID=A0A8H2K8H7_9MICO|nr:hypothetical protein [Rhodoglobus vestalii]TQO19616.1 hypothetical protein FB472_1184 [Rhodoglobus vestalii]